MRIEVLVDVKTILGEGPLWDVEEQRLYWIDSFGCNVFRATADGREVRLAALFWGKSVALAAGSASEDK